MKIGSLFAGIGGFDIAAQWMGWETAWVSEIDPYASAVLKKHFPEAPNHGDITTIKGSEVEPVDLLCGGFPCQDISIAGRGAGLSGVRSGLWSQYSRLIDEIRPQYAVIENSPMLRSRGLDVVLKDLSTFGYDAEWHCIPASSVGAPHQRDRIWIVAYSATQRLQNGSRTPLVESGSEPESERCSCIFCGLWDATNPDSEGLQGHAWHGCTAERQGEIGSASSACLCDGTGEDEVCNSLLCGCCWHKRWGPRPFAANGRWWDTEPHMGRVAYGVPNRVDRIKCIGNAIVPQVVFQIFQAIDAHRRTNLRVLASHSLPRL